MLPRSLPLPGLLLSLLLGLLASSPSMCQQPTASAYSEKHQQQHHPEPPAEDQATWLQQENVTTSREADQARLRELRLRQRRQRREAKIRAERAAEEKAMESVKVELMQDFAREHGERIRKSRQHADLFDGSGYLLDVMEELKQYKDKTEEHQGRKRRSTGDPKDERLPEFRSLSHLLAHLNEGEQAEILTGGLRLRFFNEEETDASIVEEQEDEGTNEGEGEAANDGSGEPTERTEDSTDSTATNSNGAEGQQQSSKKPKPHRRRRRSTRRLDRDEDREREAQTSMLRLDAMLADLGRQLDQEHRDARMEEAEELKTDDLAARRQQPFAGYSRHLTAAYKKLLQLRQGVDTAVPPSAREGDAASDDSSSSRQQRMGDLPQYPDMAANWDLRPEELRENMQQLRQMYRQVDEL